jgi:hypothetical protein
VPNPTNLRMNTTRCMHRISPLRGEDPDYFVEYKIRDVHTQVLGCGRRNENLRILDFGSGVGNSIPFFLAVISRRVILSALMFLNGVSRSRSVASEGWPILCSFRAGHSHLSRASLTWRSLRACFTTSRRSSTSCCCVNSAGCCQEELPGCSYMSITR